jgi:hypothetical protein
LNPLSKNSFNKKSLTNSEDFFIEKLFEQLIVITTPLFVSPALVLVIGALEEMVWSHMALIKERV